MPSLKLRLLALALAFGSGSAFNAAVRLLPRLTPLLAGQVKESKFLRDGMPLRPLGDSGLLVSKVGLGAMMWGEQVDEATATALLDVAFDEFGVNFIDTSELYPMPADEENFGAADRIIGKWLKGRDRKEVVLATKVAGYSKDIYWLRKSGEPGTRVNKAQIMESVDASLKRLGTDYIDLLQIEWPDRYTQLFGSSSFSVEDAGAAATSFVEQVEAMGELVKQGKVRHIGLSNETPYGLLKFLEAAKGPGLPAVVSVQNAYNLLERNDFETSMLEACHYTRTGLIAHSPLAGGALTGKYMLDAEKRSTASEEARLKKYVGYTGRYLLPSAQAAVGAYAELAAKYALTPEQLALAFCYSRPFVASTLVGATSVEQLRENLMALNCPLTSEMEEEIFELYCNEHREPTKGVHII